MRLAVSHVVTVIAALTLSCDTNTITQKPRKNTFVANENPLYLNEVFLKSKRFKKISTLKQGIIGYIMFNKTVCWFVIVAFL